MRLVNGIFILFLFYSSSARAYVPKEGNVNAIFGPFLYRTNLNSTPYATSPYLGGVGLIAQGDISDHGALEIAAFHMNKIFYREDDFSFLSEQIELLHITMGYRRWYTPYISASWAVYTAYALSAPYVVHKSIRAGDVLDTSASNNASYGLDLSLQYEFWSHGRFAGIFDTRYSFLLTKKKNEQSDHYGFFIGLKYFIQEKQIERTDD